MKRVYILLLAIVLIYTVNIEFKLWILDFEGTELEVNHTLNESSSEDIENIIEISNINKEYLYHDWFNPVIELITILPNNEFFNSIQLLTKWKNSKGLKSIIISNFSNFRGVDKTETIRNI